MAITRREAPSAIAQTIVSTLTEFQTGDQAMLGGAAAQEMTDPLPLFTVNIALIDRRRIDDMAERIGWRAVVIGPGGELAFADVPDETVYAGGYAQLASGPPVAGLVEAARKAERNDRDEDAFELRVVESAELKIGALWLSGDRSLFVPFTGASASPVSEDEFLHMLRVRHKALESGLAPARRDERGEEAGDAARREEGSAEAV
jgi:hypothetical protein